MTTKEAEAVEARNKIPLPTCPVCGSEMQLVEPETGVTWGTFFGCTRYTDGCRGTRNIIGSWVKKPLVLEAETEDVVAL